MVDRITQDPMMVGAIAAIQALPYLLMSIYAGVLADRLDRRSILIFSDISSFIILMLFSAYIWVNPVPSLVVLFLTAFSLSAVNVFFAPAKSAMIPTLVPAQDLQESLSISAATQHFMPLAGLAISGGVLSAIEMVSPGKFFFISSLVNGFTFLLSFTFISLLPKGLNIKDRTSTLDEVSPKPNFKAELQEGLQIVKNNAFLKSALLLSLALQFFIAPFMLVYIAANRLWFGGLYWKLAAIEASFVLMLLISSLAIGKMKIRRPGRAYVVGLSSTGVLVLMMGFWTDFPKFMLLNLLCGIGLPFASLPLQTHIQLTIPNEFMGRVQGIMQIIGMTIVPIGTAVGGLVLAKVGPSQMFMLMGGGLAVFTLLGIFLKPFFDAVTPETTPKT